MHINHKTYFVPISDLFSTKLETELEVLAVRQNVVPCVAVPEHSTIRRLESRFRNYNLYIYTFNDGKYLSRINAS